MEHSAHALQEQHYLLLTIPVLDAMLQIVKLVLVKIIVKLVLVI
jgi:hypothetical protein